MIIHENSAKKKTFLDPYKKKELAFQKVYNEKLDFIRSYN